jgi:hypothetical protein
MTQHIDSPCNALRGEPGGRISARQYERCWVAFYHRGLTAGPDDDYEDGDDRDYMIECANRDCAHFNAWKRGQRIKETICTNAHAGVWTVAAAGACVSLWLLCRRKK